MNKELEKELEQAKVLIDTLNERVTLAESKERSSRSGYVCIHKEREELRKELKQAKEQEKQLHNRIQTDQLAYNHDIEVLESANARLEERKKQLQSRLMEVLLAQAINATKEERMRLLESEQIPREIWEMRFS